jgi:hypothetical protein
MIFLSAGACKSTIYPWIMLNIMWFPLSYCEKGDCDERNALLGNAGLYQGRGGIHNWMSKRPSNDHSKWLVLQ